MIMKTTDFGSVTPVNIHLLCRRNSVAAPPPPGSTSDLSGSDQIISTRKPPNTERSTPLNTSVTKNSRRKNVTHKQQPCVHLHERYKWCEWTDGVSSGTGGGSDPCSDPCVYPLVISSFVLRGAASFLLSHMDRFVLICADNPGGAVSRCGGQRMNCVVQRDNVGSPVTSSNTQLTCSEWEAVIFDFHIFSKTSGSSPVSIFKR